MPSSTRGRNSVAWVVGGDRGSGRARLLLASSPGDGVHRQRLDAGGQVVEGDGMGGRLHPFL